MIEINCSCGGYFEVLNEQVAQRVRCPRCGALAADILAQAGQFGAVEEDSGAESSKPKFLVGCVNHPDQAATQNCMNCGKPLCMACVRENGYYCSDECRAAVSANEPSMTTDTEAAGAGDEKMNRAMSLLGAVLKKVVLLGVIGGLAYVGFLIYQAKWGPRPQITASTEVISGIDSFKVMALDSTRTLVQADDELSLVNLTTTQKLWKVDLHSLEEPFVAPKGTGEAPESAFYGDPSKFRDPLTVLDVKGDNVVLHSQRQLIVLNAKSGDVSWKFFQPDTSLTRVLVHDDGVLCVLTMRAPGKTHNASMRAACFAFADGHELWSNTNVLAYAAAVPIPGKRIVTATLDVPKTTGVHADPDQQELTASGLDVGAFRTAMFSGIQRALAKGSLDVDNAMDNPEPEPVGPGQSYTVRFRSLENGTETGHTSVSLKRPPEIEQVDRFAYVVSGRDLLVFEDGTDPLWQTTLPASGRLVAAGGNIFAVAAGDQVIAFDTKNGQQKWSRKNLKASRLFVGPDGGVYATVKLPKNEFMQSEAKKFRIEDTSTGGTTDPRAPVTFLVKLDPKNGSTSWGIRNIGGDLVFVKDNVYVFDTTTEMRLLSDTGPTDTYHSIYCLTHRNGKKVWGYVKTGTVHEHAILGDKVFLVTTLGTPLGTREHPENNYRLCLVEPK